jgi:uroporphyrinogen decarboxylase
MTGLERILTALKRQEPDRVPHFEAGIDGKAMEEILPGGSEEDFIEHMDLDAACVHYRWFTKYDMVNEDKRLARDQWGCMVQFTSELLPHPVQPVLREKKDLDTYVPPDPDETWRYEIIHRLVKRFKGQRAIVGQLPDIFNVVKDFFMGDMWYFTAMVENPDFIRRASEIPLEFYLRFVRNCVSAGVDAMLVGGDWAGTKYPFASPKHTEELIAPYLKKVVGECHKLGIPCIKHTDGNIWPVKDVLVNCGIDALHPIDPAAGLDMAVAKTELGDKLCLMGNVSCIDVLPNGPPEKIRQATKECIQKGGKGGGLICSSSNSIHSGVPGKNYEIFVQAIHEFGKYPLELD